MPGPTVLTVGEGGFVSEMDVPDEGTLAREAWDDAIAKGRIRIIEDGEPVPVKDAVAEVGAGVEDLGPGTGETAEAQPEQAPEPPAKSAPKADWVIYAVSQGADEAEAMAASKAALVEAYS